MKKQSINNYMPIIKRMYTKNNSSLIFPICNHALHFDGCCKGNPGPSGIGAVIYKNCKEDKVEINVSSRCIGNKTNNESEYMALIMGLEDALRLNISELCVCGDSLLVINQLNGVYKVNKPNLIPLYETAILLKQQFKYIDFTHIYRIHNKRADELANLGLNRIDAYTEYKPDNANENDMFIQEMNEDWDEKIGDEKIGDEIIGDEIIGDEKSFLPSIIEPK